MGTKSRNAQSSDVIIIFTPLHLQSLAADLILFTSLRGSNSLKFILEAADVAALSLSAAAEW